MDPVPIRIRQTGLGVDTTNPVSHLVYTFECEPMHITFASVDRPIDNFKGQVVGSVTDLLELNNIHVCLLAPNKTDKLQLMDTSVNKPVKDF